MNPVTGEHDIEIAGQTYVLRYDWQALQLVQHKHGDAPNLFSAAVVASVAAFGLQRRHPEMTAERIMELSPPLMPFAQSVQTALQWAYFGNEGLPKEDAKKKDNPLITWWRRIQHRSSGGLTQSNSGG